MKIKYLIEKEFKQFRRNSFLPRLAVLMPCVMMLILPWAADMETKNVRLAVVDRDNSPLSSRLTQKSSASIYFELTEVLSSYDQAMEGIERGDADIILEIPNHFERDLVREGRATVMISANTVNGTKGLLGSSYLASIVQSFSEELMREDGSDIALASVPHIELYPKILFNPKTDYKAFMVPALMVMILTLLSGFLPALNIVLEKENGTIEQINVTPVNKFTFIIAKLIPYWIIGFVVLTLCFLIAWWIYGLIPAGSFLSIYLGAIVYILVVSGFGIVISNYSGTMQQAMFLMFFFMIVLILMSGLFTPVRSMPDWAQWITVVNPLKYFIEILRSVYLKGSHVADFGYQLLALVLFAVGANLWAGLSYRKSK